MAATVHFVSPEDAEVLRKYMTPGDSNQGIALIFSKEAQTALEDAGIEDGETVDYDFGGDADAYVETVNTVTHHFVLSQKDNA
tara:strand:- start:709 stop:957 length:249 start_codon:yes stop_codon:yes gene_type:complete